MKNKFPFKFGDKVHLWGYITKKKNTNMVILRRTVGDYFWCADALTQKFEKEMKVEGTEER